MKWLLLIILLISCGPKIHGVEGPIELKNGLEIPSCFSTYCQMDLNLDNFCPTDTYVGYYGKCRLLEEWDQLTFPGAKVLRIKESCGTIVEIYNVSGSEYKQYYFYEKDDYLIGVMLVDPRSDCVNSLYGFLLNCCSR